jgi:hypothetical protein
MFTVLSVLFSGMFQLLMFLGATYLIYDVFVSDWWQAHCALRKEKFSKTNNVEKIAKVKLVSGSKKDIEQFVTDNAQYLSDSMVEKFVARLESLKADDIILEDDLLKKRITNLPNNTQAEAEEDAQTTKSQRSNN